MSKASLELGGGNWGTKDGNLLAYAQGNESSKFVPKEFTFTRGSDIAATRINSSGVIEKYRENLLLQSNQFDTTWTTSNTSVTSGQSSYDGSSDAWLLSKSAAHARLFQSVSFSGVNTFSVYAKANDSNHIRFYFDTLAVSVYFNLIDGSLGSTYGSGLVSGTSQDIGNGWWRFSVVMYGAGTGARIYPAQADNDVNGTSGSIYIQDAQLEKGLVATSYLESGATTATSGVADNEPRIDYTGGTASLLLEPSRTNLVIHSEYINSPHYGKSAGITLTNNYGESPQGVLNSTRVQSTNDNQYLLESFTLPANKTYVFTCYVKGTSGEVVRQYVDGNGAGVVYEDILLDGTWQRNDLIINTDSDGGSVNLHILFGYGVTNPARDVETWGWQLEEGSYPTSYIPTYGTSVTRVQDFNHYEDIVANPIVFGANDDFTLYYEGSFSELGNNMVMGGGNSGTNRSYWWIRNNDMTLRGAGELSIATATFTPAKNTNYKLLVKRNGSQVDFYIEGTKIPTTQQTTNTSFTLRSVGWSYNKDTYVAKGNIKQVKVFPTALTDAECTTLTFPDNPLLLNYYPNAAAAYSLRQLVALYNGNAVRVRRASDNTEQDIGFVNNVLDTSSLESFCSGTDGFVTTWYDQSGSNNATQATASAQPKIVSSGSTITENGKPVVQFDGGNDQLTVSFSTTYNQPTHSFLVHNFTSAPAAFDGLIGSIGTEHRLIINGTLKYTIQAGGALAYNEYSTDQSLVSYKIQQSDPKLFFNGTQQSVSSGTNIGTAGLQGLVLGGISSGSSSGNTPVQIQELVIFDSDQDDNRSGIETNINNYYSIYTP